MGEAGTGAVNEVRRRRMARRAKPTAVSPA
jgi:hypothetical protein